MDNIRGTHIYGQVARPANGEKFPAILIFQWAGVYPLQKEWVTNSAAQGWLVLNITAHDLPIDQPKEFYDQFKNALKKDYTAIGNTDREQSYFLRMYLACYRAAEYLSKRPDWNGKILIVAGGNGFWLTRYQSAEIGRLAQAMCLAQKTMRGIKDDDRFGLVVTYPVVILTSIFADQALWKSAGSAGSGDHP